MTALAANNANVGAGYIEHNGEQYLVRAPGQVADIADIKRHRDRIARRRAGPGRRRRRSARGRRAAHRRGDANGQEVVLGTAMMLIGENSRTVAQRVAAKLDEIAKSLPAGVHRARGLRPHQARRRDDRDRREEPGRRRAAGDRRAVPVARQLPRGAHHRLVIPLSMLITVTGMVESQGQRQPDEPRRDRFRPDRRRRGHHRRELPAAAGGASSSGAGAS